MKINKKIIFGLGALLLVGNAAYLYPKYQAVNSDPALEQHPLITELADNIENMIQSNTGILISPANFVEPLEKNRDSFEALGKTLHSDSLFRVKIWDASSTVIWSDAPELIGKRFPDNEEVAYVLASGNRKIEMKRNNAGGSDKTELLTESFYNNYFELYTPIKNPNGRVAGIVEAYQVVNGPLEKIASEFYKTAVLSLGGSLVLLALAFFVGAKTNRRS